MVCFVNHDHLSKVSRILIFKLLLLLVTFGLGLPDVLFTVWAHSLNWWSCALLIFLNIQANLSLFRIDKILWRIKILLNLRLALRHIHIFRILNLSLTHYLSFAKELQRHFTLHGSDSCLIGLNRLRLITDVGVID